MSPVVEKFNVTLRNKNSPVSEMDTQFVKNMIELKTDLRAYD